MTGGQRLAQELKGKGNVVVFTMPDQPNLQDRLRGYKDALANTPEIKITRVVDIQGDPRIAFDTTTQIIGKERDKVDGFVCLEAQSGKEVAGVLNSYHVTGKVVIAMDTDQETLDWIQKGVIAATIAQKPYTMAFVGMQMLDNLYHHKPRFAGQGLVERQVCSDPELRGYRLGPDRQEQRGVVHSGREKPRFGTKITTGTQAHTTCCTDGDLMRKLVLSFFAVVLTFSPGYALDRQPNADYHARRVALAKKAAGVVVLFAPLEAGTPSTDFVRTTISTISPV